MCGKLGHIATNCTEAKKKAQKQESMHAIQERALEEHQSDATDQQEDQNAEVESVQTFDASGTESDDESLNLNLHSLYLTQGESQKDLKDASSYSTKDSTNICNVATPRNVSQSRERKTKKLETQKIVCCIKT